VSDAARRRGRWMWGVVLVLGVLHYDWWNWGSTALWFGFLPAGLGYHAFYSLLAGLTWFGMVRLAWPAHVEEWADRGDDA